MVTLELVTLDGTKLRDQVHEVIVPTANGYIGVFKNHAAMISLAVPGVISVRRSEKQPDDLMDHYATNGGVVEISDDVVKILVDEADSATEINEKEIEKALDAARKLRSEAKDQVSLDHAQQLIDRSAVRLKVAELRRRKR